MKEIDKIYNNFDRLCDNYVDLEDTNKGYKELETYIIKETFHGVPGWEKEQMHLIDEVTKYAALNEKTRLYIWFSICSFITHKFKCSKGNG